MERVHLCRLQRSATLGNLLHLLVVWTGLQGTIAVTVAADAFESRRDRMVRDYIAAEGVRHPQVLAAMKRVPRHQFVLPAHRKHAYEDLALAIGHKQTISPPFIVAYMTGNRVCLRGW